MASDQARTGEPGANKAFGVRAFTLVEIIVVIVVLGILAAVVVPKFTDASTESSVAATAEDLKAFELALDMYHAQHAAYPPEVAQATAVAQLDPYFKAANPFAKTCPIGGAYDYEGTPNDPVEISIRQDGANVYTAASALALDEHFDDGNLATGRLRQDGATRLRYLVVPD